jgi:hypothetical protein
MIMHKTDLDRHGYTWEVWELPLKDNSLAWLSLKFLWECYPICAKYRSYGDFIEWLATPSKWNGFPCLEWRGVAIPSEDLNIVIKAAMNNTAMRRYVKAMLLDTPQEKL